MEPTLLKLINGEELLGYVEKFNESYTIKKPAILIPQEKGIALFPYMAYTLVDELGLSFDSKHVLIETPVREDMAQSYREFLLNLERQDMGQEDVASEAELINDNAN